MIHASSIQRHIDPFYASRKITASLGSGPLKAPCNRHHGYSRCRPRRECRGSEGTASASMAQVQTSGPADTLSRAAPTPSPLGSPFSWMHVSYPDSSRCWSELHLNVPLQGRCFCASGSRLAWRTHRLQAAHPPLVSIPTPAASTLNIRSESVSVLHVCFKVTTRQVQPGGPA